MININSRSAVKNLCKVLILLTTLSLCGSDSAYAGQPRFGHLGVADGLSQGVVLSIFQDSQGFMWFCTEDGLNKFDGYDITVYKHEPDNSNSLSSSHVWAVYEEKDTRTLWVATSNGLDKLDLQTGRFVHYRHDENDPHSLSNNDVRAIHEDHAGTLWIATWGGGLNTFDRQTERFTHFQHDPDNPASLSSNSTLWGNSLYEDPAGTLWIGTGGGGFNKYDRATGGFISYQPDEHNPNSVNSEYVGTFASGKDEDVLWIGSAGGLNKFNSATETFVSYPEFNRQVVVDIFRDRTGNLWLCTENGLFLFDEATETVLAHYSHDPSNQTGIAGDDLNNMYQDQSGMLWIGTWGSGVNTFDPAKPFMSYQHSPKDPNSPGSSRIEGFGEGLDGNLWIAGNAVLDKLDRQTETFTHYAKSLPSDRIIGFAQDRERQILWLSTRDGLVGFDPQRETFEQYQHDPNNPNSLLHTDLENVFLDNTGMLWITSWSFGTSKFDPGHVTFEHYLHEPDNPQSISSNLVHMVYEDTQGILWFGTDAGLSRLNRMTNTFTHYQHDENDPKTLSKGNVNTIYEDTEGFLWIGFLGGGFNKFDPATGTVHRYNHANSSLPNDTVNCIVGSSKGVLWISTNVGLSKFDPDTEIFANYNVGDGLPGSDFIQNACLKTSRGELAFGTYSNGFILFQPDDIQDSSPVFPLMFTDFKLFDKHVAVGEGAPLPRHINFIEKLTLLHRQNVFTLEFAALKYNSPENLKYKYMMEGLDHDWIEVSSDSRSVRYTNLAPGEYVFTVKARTHSGVWGEKGKSITINVLPPWWRTWWAYTLYALLAFGIMLGYGHLRLRLTEAKKRLLEIQVAERTSELKVAKEKAETANQAKTMFLANMSHELRSPLNAILGFAQVMTRSVTLPPEHRESADIIHRSGDHLLMVIDQVLDLAKLEAGRTTLNESYLDLHHFLFSIRDMFALKADNKNLQLAFELDESVPRWVCTDEVKLRQVLINVLSNAIKFTMEGGVAVRVHSELCNELPAIAPSREGEDNGSSTLTATLHFEVEDTGPGITPEETDQVFENFGQTRTGRQSHEGTGLGLPISLKFVQLMGGDMRLSSVVGQGTTFSFDIQVQVGEASDLAPPEPVRRVVALEPGQRATDGTLTGDGRYRILIVDDIRTNRQLMLKLLSPLGFDLREAENGQEAIEIWESWKPHLIWMDMRMPVMDGYEATRWIRAQSSPEQRPVIVAVTASVFEEDRTAVISIGCNDIITKPFRESEIMRMLHKHLDVRFQYEDEPGDQAVISEAKPDGLTTNWLAELPSDLFASLKVSVAALDMDEALNVVEKIRTHDEGLANAIKMLVEQYRFDKLLEILEREKEG